MTNAMGAPEDGAKLVAQLTCRMRTSVMFIVKFNQIVYRNIPLYLIRYGESVCNSQIVYNIAHSCATAHLDALKINLSFSLSF